jgi:formylglycine-generating enzyme required for sulfatase activity
MFMPIKPAPTMGYVNDIMMMNLPGGVFAMGSSVTHGQFGDSRPRMVRVAPFAAGMRHVSEDQYRETVGHAGRAGARGTHPASCLNVADCKEFLEIRNQRKGESEQIGFLTEAELEYIARGRAIDVRQLMASEGILGAEALADYLNANGCFLENFVPALDLGATIIAQPTSAGFRELIDGDSSVFAWRAWGTRSGRFDLKEAWCGRQGTAPLWFAERANTYGISDVIGNVWSWGADRYTQNAYGVLPQENPYNTPRDGSEKIVLRGGSWFSDNPLILRAAYRHSISPDERLDTVGLRVKKTPPVDHPSHPEWAMTLLRWVDSENFTWSENRNKRIVYNHLDPNLLRAFDQDFQDFTVRDSMPASENKTFIFNEAILELQMLRVNSPNVMADPPYARRPDFWDLCLAHVDRMSDPDFSINPYVPRYLKDLILRLKAADC